MLKTNKRAMLKALGAAAMVAGMSAGPAWAQAPIVLKMAHIYNPGNIWFNAAESYAKAVETKSGGKVKSRSRPVARPAIGLPRSRA